MDSENRSDVGQSEEESRSDVGQSEGENRSDIGQSEELGDKTLTLLRRDPTLSRTELARILEKAPSTISVIPTN